jgi:iron complex transport system substrate-binding protein
MPVYYFKNYKLTRRCGARTVACACVLALGCGRGGRDASRMESPGASSAAARATRGDSSPSSPLALPARDDFGRPIPTGVAARRIVSLNPTTTEALFAIGAGARLVGRSQYDLFPDSARLVPSVGPALRPNLEAVLGARPDLVLLYASADNREALDRLSRAGVSVVGFKIDSIEQFERDAIVLGRLTGDSARASTLVDSIAATLARVRAATANLPRPTVFMPIWERPLIVIGGGSFMSELLDIAGARNVYGDIAAPSGTVTMEDVVRRNPDLVLVSPNSAVQIHDSPQWRAIPAVRAGHVMVYDTLLVSRPSVVLGAAARSIAELLHPGVLR